MENTEGLYMDYINKEEHGMLRENHHYRELADNSSSASGNTFTLTDEAFSGLFIVLPVGFAALAGSISGVITNVPAADISDDTKTLINRITRTFTALDVVATSIGSLYYGSSSQVTTAQHTITAIWVWTGVPAAFVAAEKLMQPLFRAPAA